MNWEYVGAVVVLIIVVTFIFAISSAAGASFGETAWWLLKNIVGPLFIVGFILQGITDCAKQY